MPSDTDSVDGIQGETTVNVGQLIHQVATLMDTIEQQRKEIADLKTRVIACESGIANRTERLSTAITTNKTGCEQRARAASLERTEIGNRVTEASETVNSRVDAIQRELDSRVSTLSVDLRSHKEAFTQFKVQYQSDRRNDATFYRSGAQVPPEGVNTRRMSKGAETTVKQPLGADKTVDKGVNLLDMETSDERFHLKDLGQPGLDTLVKGNCNEQPQQSQLQSGPGTVHEGQNSGGSTQALVDQLIRSMNKPVKMELPKFSGKSANTWIWKFKITAKHLRLSEEEMCRRVVGCMEGEAADWFLAHFVDSFNSFKEFEDKFRDRYDCDNSEHAVTRRISLAQQQEGQSGSEFIDLMKRYNMEMDSRYSDADLYDFIRKGLSLEYAKIIVSCETLATAVKAIKKYDRLKEEAVKGGKTPAVSFSEKPTIFPADTPLPFTASRLKRSDELPASSTPLIPQTPYRPKTYDCYACGQKGHLANQCPNRQPREGGGGRYSQGHNQPQQQREYEFRPRSNTNYNEKRPYNKQAKVNELDDGQVDLRPEWQQENNGRRDPTPPPTHHCETVAEVSDEVDANDMWFGAETAVRSRRLSGLTLGAVNSTPKGKPVAVSGPDGQPQIEMGGLPIIYIRIGPFKVKALLDSGSVLSAVSPRLAVLLSRNWEAWEGPDLKLADGKPAKPYGVVWTELELDRKVVQMPVAILKDMAVDALLGMNFMGSMDIVLMAGRKRYFLFEDLSITYNMNSGLMSEHSSHYETCRKKEADYGVAMPTESPFIENPEKVRIFRRVQKSSVERAVIQNKSHQQSVQCKNSSPEAVVDTNNNSSVEGGEEVRDYRAGAILPCSSIRDGDFEQMFSRLFQFGTTCRGGTPGKGG